MDAQKLDLYSIMANDSLNLFVSSFVSFSINEGGGEFHISHEASRQKERSRVSREIFNDLNFKMQLIQGKF